MSWWLYGYDGELQVIGTAGTAVPNEGWRILVHLSGALSTLRGVCLGKHSVLPYLGSAKLFLF